MPRSAALAALFTLAACVQPAPAPLGEFRIGAETYRITENAAGTWRVLVDGRSVICSKPTEEACYWSVRHYLTSQEVLNDYG
ncbi:hypothetical protein OEZ71_03980 [Defluviimonas sp. WL0050]|uniref:Uncharacterized protein n=1 Tax=Albidovulum litorale TaxID=2984134 RepID=A0ABT2ZJZ9_9RHOB|nr:hypothetical protein [Defluviimonas sp. WL0050]MCV2871449.1 hypothetical protein [Defluviimonas sp. WL0050]